MAISSNLVVEWNKNLSVEELEKQYKDLEIHYCFETKDDQIKYMIDTFLDASNETNVKSTREGLEILLKEKTGKDYTINENKFEITLMDIIDYVASKTDLLSNKNLFINFFKEFDDVDEFDKIDLLITLVHDTENFANLLKDLQDKKDPDELYDKYYEITEAYYSDNRVIS